MKIVYLLNNPWFPGGQTRVLANKVNYWVEHGHEVYILTADQIGYPPFYPIAPKVKMIDFAIGYMGADQLGFWEKVKRLSCFLVRHYKLLSQTLKEISPDIVVSMYGKEIYFLPFIKDGSVKVLEAHGARYTWLFSRKGLLGKLHNWLDLRFIRCFDYNKLAEGIIRLIADENLRKEMGRKAKKRSSLFSQEAVMQRWTEVFTQLISKKKKQ